MTRYINKYFLEMTVFLCGASLMVLELVGSRVLAPYIGTSTIVWTSLIGIIMGFLSLGYWYGGKLADKNPSRGKLSLIIVWSALFVLAIVALDDPFLKLISASVKNIYFDAVAATLLLFSLPSFLLGIVSPYAVKLKLSALENSGRTVGDLYAISTVGSIVGTFAAGFLLIPFLGTTRILYLLAAVLLLASILVFPGKLLKTRTAGIAIILAAIAFSFAASAKATVFQGVIDVDSQYNRIKIYRARGVENNRPALFLSTDPQGVQSAMYLDKDDELVFRYSRYFRLSDVFFPEPSRILVIGAAAYSFPKDFLKRHPSASIDVVEIDPKMTELAEKYFNLPDEDRLSIYHQDGRVFLNGNKKKYDAIFVDVFNSRLSLPHQLTTREAVQRIFDSLSDDGVVMTNIISAIEGDSGKFLRAEYATYKDVFPQVYLFQVYNSAPQKIQNLIMVAKKGAAPLNLKSPSAEMNNYLDLIWKRPVANDLPVLTDDYAPVDYYMMSSF